MKRRIQTNIILMAVAVVAALALVATIGSQSFADDAANVLKISPLRTDIQIAPGASKTVDITISNTTGAAVAISPIENDFVSADESGTPSLILDANKFAPTHSLKRFMQPLSDIVIPANSAKTVHVVINVPASAQSGGYFGAIRFAPTSPDGGKQVNLSANAASLILLTVPGPTTEKLNLTNFEVQQKGKSASYFQTPDNLSMFIRFENKGNLQEGPFGSIAVKKGDKVVYQTSFNTNNPSDVVLPDSARRWDVPLKNIGSFGHYSVEATLTYGQKNQTIDVTRTFWVVPTVAIVAAVGALVVLAAIIVGIWLFLRSYKRRILRAAQSNHSNIPR